MEHAEAIERARAAFRSGKTRDIVWRQNQLRALICMMEENMDRIRTVLRNDLNKVDVEVEIEVTSVHNEAAEAIDSLKYWIRPELVPSDMSSMMAKMTINPEPRGIVLIIGPWNFPLNCLLRPLVSAIASGCTAVIKPSEVALSTCRLMIELIPLYLDKDAFPIIFANGPETADILAQFRFDLVFFTGSSQIGKLVYQAAAAHLTPVVLELGGKNPVWVDETADLDNAAKRIMWGRCINTGQICLAPEYVLAPEKLMPSLIAALKKATTQMYSKAPELSTSYSGKIINKMHFDRITQTLGATNGTIVHGGKNDPTKFFIEPTIVKDVTEKDALMQQEIFGPVLSLVTCDTFNQAVDFINDRDTPLAAYCFTKDKITKNRFESEVRSGGQTINDVLLHVSQNVLPFGGLGASGMGSYAGYHGFIAFSHFKSIYKSWAPEAAMAFMRPPYGVNSVRWLRLLMRKNPKPRWMPNIRFPLLIDYALTLILYALMIALIVKVFASDHLHFRNPFEFDWDTHPANPNNLNIPDSTDSPDYPQ